MNQTQLDAATSLVFIHAGQQIWASGPHWFICFCIFSVIYLVFMTIGLAVNVSFSLFGYHKSYNPWALFLTGIEFMVTVLLFKGVYHHIRK